jgi:2-amino-4-hydroxy-6-hydroxymethyldihydropteridine diphosphokinase
VQVVEISALYRSAALGPPQPDYLNAALLLELRSDPLELLALLGRLEQRHGRLRRERWGPRTLDLDILWIGGSALDSPTLTVPHPRLTERAFALLPLLELVPDAIEPASGRPYTKYLPAVKHQEIERLGEPWN